MSLLQGFFIFVAVLMLISALRVITVKNPVHAALYLVFCFICAGVVWLLLEAEFLAIALVLVYVGAVMVLFLFVIMMLDIHLEKLRQGLKSLFTVGVVFSVLVLLFVAGVLVYDKSWGDAQGLAAATKMGNTRALGNLLYTHYVFAFELASVILLVAMIAAVILTLRKRTEVKRPEPGEQVKVSKSERLRVLNRPASQWRAPQ